MSRSKDTRPDPRIAVKEEIMTRNKAAQMKRQLQEKANSIPNSPVQPASPASPVKSKRGRKRKNETQIRLDAEAKRKYVKKFEKPSKPPAKKQPKVVENKEYFPNNLKRPYKTDKVVLKAKMESKLIGGMNSINKRKLLIPKRVTEETIAYNEAENDHSEEDDKPSVHLSVTELAQMTLDTESLTEEDWLEILTCPSPVWWEDPPYSPEYCEDPISTRLEDEENTKNTNSVEENINKDLKSETVLKVTDLNTCIDSKKQSDNKFMKKRSKLENLLYSIKNKLVSNDDSIEINIEKNNDVNISDITCVLNENNEINEAIVAVEDKLEVSEDLDSKSKSCNDEMEKSKCEEDDILEVSEDLDSKSKSCNDEMEKSKCEEEDILDASLDDELLETLESFYIPIENETVGCDGNNDNTEENKEENLNTKELNTKTKDLDSKLKLKETSDESDEIESSMTSKDDEYCVEDENNESSDRKSIKVKNVVEVEPSTSSNVVEVEPTTSSSVVEVKPSTTSNVVKVEPTTSSNLVEVELSTTSNVVEVELSTTSNVVEVEPSSSSNVVEDEVEVESLTSFDELIEKEYVTLYKIVSSDGEVSNFENLNESLLQFDDDKSKIDGFYKKRKHSSNKRNANQKDNALNEKSNKKNQEESFEQKLVAVADKQNMKYCKKCSSIFDTETCMYCDKRTDKETNTHGSKKNRLCAT